MKNSKIFYRFLLGIIVGIISYQVTFCQPFNVWGSRYNGPANLQDSAIGITAVNGNVFVTGWSLSNASTRDIVTIRYNYAAGDSAWVNRYSVSNGISTPTAIVADNNFVYVTGWTLPSGSNRVVVTIKYNISNGVPVWVKTYSNPSNGGSYGLGIAVDLSGNVYVSGLSDLGGANNVKFACLKYDASGNMVSGFPVFYTGSLSTSYDRADYIKLDASGNIYLAGIAGINTGNEDYMTLKLNSSGIVQWAKRYNGTANSTDVPTGLVLNSGGTAVFVTGFSNRTGANYDYVTIKYGTTIGDSLAAAIFNGSANAADQPVGIAIDPSNNIYVTGSSQNSSGTYDYATLKYDGATLGLLWGPKIYHSANGNSLARAIVYDSAGFVYVTGSSVGSGTGYDFATVRYMASNGTQQWIKTENGPASGNDYVSGIVSTGPFNVYVTGSMNFGAPTGLDFYTIRYTENLGIQPIGGEVPKKFSLSQNYPNPFNPSTSIKFDIPNSTQVKLVVYNVLGSEVSKLVDDYLVTGSYEVKWDASNVTSGIYFYKLFTDKFTETKKMMLVK